ncbi:hypothetical protein LP419_30990 [Massilia sp. H-1]|nr:hypothetical protein LP419_30990 [Massilia sp. H-1]
MALRQRQLSVARTGLAAHAAGPADAGVAGRRTCAACACGAGSPPPPPEPRSRPVLGRLFPGSHTAPLKGLPAPSPEAAPRLQNEAAPPPQAMLDAEQADPPSALMMLARRMGLTRFETMTMLMCVAIELDPQMAALYARPRATRRAPSRALRWP